MKNVFIILISLLSISFIVNAQDSSMFEGELVYTNFENHSKIVRKLSSGMAYNGVRNIRVIIKNNADIHMIDETLHMHTLLLASRNKAIIYNDLIKEGQEFSYSAYVSTYLDVFAPDASSSDYHVEYNLGKTGETKEHLEKKCVVYKGQYIKGVYATEYTPYTEVRTDLEIWAIAGDYSVYKSYWHTINGLQIPGYVAKYTYNQNGSLPLFGKLSSYVASELKEMNARKVTDEEMSVPEGYKIKVSNSPFKVLKLYKRSTKYLKKNNMYPSQKDSEVTYQIDDKWDF